MNTAPAVRVCTVYRSHGRTDTVVLARDRRPNPPPGICFADEVPIGAVMANDLVCARPDLGIAEVVRLLVSKHIGCLPVVDQRQHPIGVITKFDLVEQLDAAMQIAGTGSPLPGALTARTAEEVMMPIALSIDEHATLAHASSMMVCEDTHHVLVTDRAGALVGVVSAKDIVGWITRGVAQPALGAEATYR